MTTLLVIVWLLLIVAFGVLVAMRPVHSKHTWFELKKSRNEEVMRRERLLGDVYGLRRVLLWLLSAYSSVLAFVLWGWWSIAIMGVIFCIMVPVARARFVQKQAMRLYHYLEKPLLAKLEQWPVIGRIGRYERFTAHDQKLESPEQLLHLVETSGGVLSDDQQNIIRHGLAWHTTTVESIMTKRADIVTIKHRELLGPLVLDDLHKSGHNRFPVIKGSLNDIVGVIDITELLEVTAGRSSQTAEQAMSPRVLRIEADEPLPVALALLQKSHQHLLIVVDGEGDTIGIVTLADITGSLLGKTGVK